MTEVPFDSSSSLLDSFNRLLKAPEAAAAAAAKGESRAGTAFFLGALGCFVLYGAAAGFFQGGTQVLIASLKVPAIIFGTAIICFPSLHVFTSLAGSELAPSRTLVLLAGFCGILSLLMLGMIPIVWLFSVGSRSIHFIFWMHLLAWLAAVVLARQFLVHIWDSTGQRRALRLWIFLFVLVSFQMTTHLRPVLWREPQQGVIDTGRLSFVEHFRIMSR